jgi:hypothetical protein
MYGFNPRARCGVDGRADGSKLLGLEWKMEKE